MVWPPGSMDKDSWLVHDDAVAGTRKASARTIYQAAGIYGGRYFEDLTLAAPRLHPMVAADTWELFAAFGAAYFSHVINAGTTIPAGHSGTYIVSGKILGIPSDATAWRVAVCVGGVPLPGGERGVVGSTALEDIGVDCRAELIQGDTVELRILFDSLGALGGAPGLAIYAAHCSVRRAS